MVLTAYFLTHVESQNVHYITSILTGATDTDKHNLVLLVLTVNLTVNDIDHSF